MLFLIPAGCVRMIAGHDQSDVVIHQTPNYIRLQPFFGDSKGLTAHSN